MREHLIDTAVDTIAGAAKDATDTITGPSTSSGTATATSSSESKVISSTSSSTSSTPATSTPTVTTTAPISTSNIFADTPSSSGNISLSSSTDKSSSAETSRTDNRRYSSSSSSFFNGSNPPDERVNQQGDKDQGKLMHIVFASLSTEAVVGIPFSGLMLLVGLLIFWKHIWSQTPISGLRSAFHTKNLENSDSSNSSAPLAMWEDEDITATRIPFEKITTTKLISYGGHGQVYLGMYRSEQVAIKRLLPEKRKKLHEVNTFLSEIKMMVSVEHPRIVRFIGVAWDSLTDLCAVSEFMDGGDLHSLLKRFEAEKRSHGFDFDKARIALQVVHALSYLHSLDPIVLHRDLKSMNIFLTSNLEAKITDFGVSRQWSVDTMTAGVGTALWMAPEVMMGEHYDSSADIFSFGIVMSELDSHWPPYREMWSTHGQKISDTAILEMVPSGQLRIEFSPNAPLELVDLAHACVNLDPTARPSANEVLYRLRIIRRTYEAYSI